MDIFPISLKLQQQRCLIVGGGHIALRKATLLAKAGEIICLLYTSDAADEATIV